MAKLIIGSWGTEAEMAALSTEMRRHAGSHAQRLLWDARPGDVIVLPFQPDQGFLSYATALLGFDAAALKVVVPAKNEGEDLLTRDRLDDEAFVAELREIVRDREVDQVDAFYFGGSVNQLLRRLGLDKCTPGFGFVDQGGDELLNSKVMFRMLAAGTNLPVPDGIVTDTVADAVEFLWDLLRSGRSAIVKQDGGTAGAGNEILTPAAGVNAIGALHHLVFTDRAALVDHVTERWSWYTEGLRRRAVFEEYVPNSVPIWGEVSIRDDAAEIYGYGKVVMRPVCEGVIIPVPRPDSDSPAFDAFLKHLQALGETLRGIGYRGLANPDAILTPDGRVLFNEINGRHGGSTHLFVIGERVVGRGYLDDRCLLERRECAFPAFDVTYRRLVDHGLAYDPTTRTGVVIPVYGTNPDGTGGEACVIGKNLDEAEDIERALVALFPA